MTKERLDQKYHRLIGKKLKSVRFGGDKESLVFTFGDGTRAAYIAEGQCCSSSYLDSLLVPDDIEGQSVVDLGEIETGDNENGSVFTRYYRATFQLSDGREIVARYSNESNGSCPVSGGCLEPRAIHDEVPLDMRPREARE